MLLLRWHELQIYAATSQKGMTAFLRLGHDDWSVSVPLNDIRRSSARSGRTAIRS
jgi:hypothetical protein